MRPASFRTINYEIFARFYIVDEKEITDLLNKSEKRVFDLLYLIMHLSPLSTPLMLKATLNINS